MKIPFNKPYYTGNETAYVKDAFDRGHISGNGYYTQKCQAFFEEKYGFRKCLLTTSCTDALEMSAILLDLKPGDEVIMPSFTFVSTANAFVLRGAKIVFIDSRPDHPGMDESLIEEVITPKTRAIVAFITPVLLATWTRSWTLPQNTTYWSWKMQHKLLIATIRVSHLGELVTLQHSVFMKRKILAREKGDFSD